MIALIFLLAGLGAIITAVLMITRTNPVHSALWLVLTFCCLSVLYFLLSAPLIGILQVIVYAGAIMVLFLFVIMLLAAERREFQEPDPVRNVRWLGYTFGVLFLAIMGHIVWRSPLLGLRGQVPPSLSLSQSTQLIGNALFTQYLLSFEITSILLLIAMIGAIVIAKRRLIE